MREIVERLTENRQIEVAKSILESNGYKVTKKSRRLKESTSLEPTMTAEEMIGDYDMDEAIPAICKYLGADPSDVYFTSEEDVEDPDEFFDIMSNKFKKRKDISKDPAISADLGSDSEVFLGTLPGGSKAVSIYVLGAYEVFWT